VQEIEDPELTAKRTRELYKLKGYSDAWIEKLNIKKQQGLKRDDLCGCIYPV